MTERCHDLGCGHPAGCVRPVPTGTAADDGRTFWCGWCADREAMGRAESALASALDWVPDPDACAVCCGRGRCGIAEDSCPRCGLSPEECDEARALRAGPAGTGRREIVDALGAVVFTGRADEVWDWLRASAPQAAVVERAP